jgi:hypothetical protein
MKSADTRSTVAATSISTDEMLYLLIHGLRCSKQKLQFNRRNAFLMAAGFSPTLFLEFKKCMLGAGTTYWTYYMAIKIYNSLPTQIKETAYDPKQFRKNLKSFLYFNSFYTLQEYFNHDK